MRKLLYGLMLLPFIGLSQSNLDLPVSTSTTGQIRIGGKTVLHTYGINNYFAAGAGNFVMQQQGTNNVAIGLESLQKNLLGDNNTALGHYAGKMNRYGIGNIFIGYNAGNNSVFADLNNRLIIDNTTTTLPFIYGNMATGYRVLTINADFTVTGDVVTLTTIPLDEKPYGLHYDTLTGHVSYGPVVSLDDSSLFYLSLDTIRNKNHYKFYPDDSIYFYRNAIPYLEPGDPLAGFLTLKKLPGTSIRQLAMSSMQNMVDSLTVYGIGYWELINGHLRPVDDIDSIQAKIIQADTIWAFYDTVFSTYEDTTYNLELVEHCYDTNTIYMRINDTIISGLNYRYARLGDIGYDFRYCDIIHIKMCCYDEFDTICEEFGNPIELDLVIDSIYVDVGYVEYWEIPGIQECNTASSNIMCNKLFYEICVEHYDTAWSYFDVYDTILVRGIVFIDDDLTVTGDDVKFTGIPDSTTDHIIYYNEADGRISYGELSNNDIWYLDNDTAKTNYNVVVDSSFLMRYKYYKFGYESLSESIKLLGFQRSDSAQNIFSGVLEGVPIPGLGSYPYFTTFVNRNNSLGSSLFMGTTTNKPFFILMNETPFNTSGLLFDEFSFEVGLYDAIDGQSAIFKIDSNSIFLKTNELLTPGGFEVYKDTTTFDGILKTNILPEQSAPYLVGWNNTTKELVAVDSTGIVFHSEVGFYQEELSTTKTIFNLGFTITNDALVSLNGTIINPSQWTGIGTSTLTLLLDTQQYDLFTIKQ